MTADPTRKPWSRRKWALYWLFIAVVLAAVGTLSYAVEYGDMQLAAVVVALMMSAFVVAFMVWVVRLLRSG